jgi:hypothetical protein
LSYVRILMLRIEIPQDLHESLLIVLLQ